MKQITKEIKDIRDHLHLYLGREAEVINKPDGLAITDHPQIVTIDGTVVDCSSMMYESIKPILRKLSSMTEEEAIEFIKVFDKGLVEEGEAVEFKILGKEDNDWIYVQVGYEETECCWEPKATWMQAEMFRLFLSKGFDLFGLIDSGIAIEK